MDETVDVKECIKLQLLMFALVATEESDKEATPSSNVTTKCFESTDTTDDGETAPTYKKPKSGPVSSLFAGMSWSNKRRLNGIQAVESELRRYEDEENIDLDTDPIVRWSV